MKQRTVWFLIAAWLLPASIAGALGWSSIWGTGSAFVDDLIPFPTTAGFLHLPSVIACAALIGLSGTDRPAAALARPLLLGIGLAGAVLLIDVADLHLAATTDASAGHLGAQNPVGLFLICDGFLAQLFVPLRARGRIGARWIAAGVLAALAPAAIVAYNGLRYAPSAHYPLLHGARREGPARGDEIVTLYSQVGFAPDRLEAEIRVDPMFVLPPELHENAEDQAVYFFDSFAAARDMRLDAARVTWCRYEDGTPSRWIDGAGECFADHVTFGERWEQSYGSVDPALSPDVRSYVARRAACANVVLGSEPQWSSVAAQQRCAELPRLREELLARSPASEPDLRALNP